MSCSSSHHTPAPDHPCAPAPRPPFFVHDKPDPPAESCLEMPEQESTVAHVTEPAARSPVEPINSSTSAPLQTVLSRGQVMLPMPALRPWVLHVRSGQASKLPADDCQKGSPDRPPHLDFKTEKAKYMQDFVCEAASNSCSQVRFCQSCIFHTTHPSQASTTGIAMEYLPWIHALKSLQLQRHSTSFTSRSG